MPETQKEKALSGNGELMAAQLKQARIEFDTLRRMQDQTRQYRHDMRHHFALLQSLAVKGDVAKISHYLQTVSPTWRRLPPCVIVKMRLLICSYLLLKRRQNSTMLFFSVEASLPEVLSISDTELCSCFPTVWKMQSSPPVLYQYPKKELCLCVSGYSKGNCFFSVENPYEGNIVLQGGLPQTFRDGHGYGTRSISSIAELYGGQALFSANDGIFTKRL